MIEGKELTDALHVPRQAVFEKNGKNHVFVKAATASSSARSRSTSAPRAAPCSRGCRKATEVALVDPTLRATGRGQSNAPPLPAAGADPMTSSRIPTVGRYADFLPELRLGLENLRAHKLRSLLTMLGMIFGVAAVVAMLSIGAGAQQEVMAFIEQLGVRNLIVEAREAPD